MRRALPLLVLLAGCGERAPDADRSPGARLEAAATRAGLVADPTAGSLGGAWGRDTDRVCLVPAADRYRIGVSIDYGEGQSCAASGTAERRGAKVRVSFGDCRLDAAFDGERLSFPAELPSACDSLCTGRASLTALSVERLGSSVSEAATMRSAAGKALCDG